MSLADSYKPLLLILLGALMVRIAAGGILQWQLEHRWGRNFLIEGDAIGYWELGERLADGRSYELFDPPRQVLRMPGLPLLLAGAMKIADGIGLPEKKFLIARIVMAVVGTMACWLVYLLGAELFDRQIGQIAAGIAALFPVMAGFSVVLLSETLFAACLLGSLLMMAKFHKATLSGDGGKKTIGWALAVGMTIALACYVRPSWLLAAPLFVLFHFISTKNKRRAVWEGCLICLGLAVALAPWTIRNHHVTGHWVYTTLWLGPSLYDGLNPEATGDSNMEFFDRDNLMSAGMSEYEMNRHYTRQAVRYALDHPGRTVALGFAKLWRFWKPWPNAVQFENWPAQVSVALFFIPLLVLAGIGWWSVHRETWNWMLTIGPILYFSLLHTVFVGSLRYRLPAEYPLCVLSAVGLVSCLRMRRGGDRSG